MENRKKQGLRQSISRKKKKSLNRLTMSVRAELAVSYKCQRNHLLSFHAAPRTSPVCVVKYIAAA